MPEAPKPPTKKRPDAINMHLANKAGALPIAPYTGPEMHAPTSGDIQANLPTAGGVIRPQAPYEKAAGAIQNSTLGTLFSTGANIQNNVRDSVGNVLNMPLPGNPQVGGQVLNVGDANDIAMMVGHSSPYEFPPEPGAPYGRFNMDRALTGQGAMSQGWGGYLWSNRGVGQNYLEAFRGAPDILLDGKPIDPVSVTGPQHVVDGIVHVANQGGIDQALAFINRLADQSQETVNDRTRQLQEIATGHSPTQYYGQADNLRTQINAYSDDVARSRRAADWINTNRGRFSTGPERGAVYAVDLPDTDIANMLQYETPLKEHDPTVQKRIQNVIDLGMRGMPKVAAFEGQDLLNGTTPLPAYQRAALEHVRLEKGDVDAAIKGLTWQGDFYHRNAHREGYGNSAAYSYAAADWLNENRKSFSMERPSISPTASGWDVYNSLARNSKLVDKSYYEPGAKLSESQILSKRNVSKALAKAGVPGTQYLDQLSRPGAARPRYTGPAPEMASEARSLRLAGMSKEEVYQHLSGKYPRAAAVTAALSDAIDWAYYEPQKPTHNYVIYEPEKLKIIDRIGYGREDLSPRSFNEFLQRLKYPH